MKVLVGCVVAALAGWCGGVAAQEGAPRPAAAATSAASLPKAEELFEAHIAVVGGIEKIRSEKSSIVRARVAIPAHKTGGSLAIYREAPAKVYTIFDIPGEITVETWCDGKDAWVRDSNSGVKRIKGDAVHEFIRMADFYGEANYKTRYKTIETVEKTTFADRPAYAVRAATPDGSDRVLYFDAEKKYMIGQKIAAGGGRPERLLTFSEYKELGAVLLPSKIVENENKVEVVTTITASQSNAPVADRIDPPEDVRKVQ